jgi:hypothetical protein
MQASRNGNGTPWIIPNDDAGDPLHHRTTPERLAGQQLSGKIASSPASMPSPPIASTARLNPLGAALGSPFGSPLGRGATTVSVGWQQGLASGTSGLHSEAHPGHHPAPLAGLHHPTVHLTDRAHCQVMGAALDEHDFTVRDPSTGTVLAGVGIFVQREHDGHVFVSEVLPRGAAELSGQVCVADELTSVDGVPVTAHTPLEKASRHPGHPQEGSFEPDCGRTHVLTLRTAGAGKHPWSCGKLRGPRICAAYGGSRRGNCDSRCAPPRRARVVSE